MTSTLDPTPVRTPVSTSASTAPHAWDEPDGVAARGTVVVLTGRGESAAAYGRLGRRISADAWKVRVVELDLDDLAAGRDAVRDLLTDPTLPAPRVLVGTDTGATFAAVLADGGQHALDGVVLAGLALPGSSPTSSAAAAAPGADWDAELETRTACPAHRRVLSEDVAFERGSLHRDLPGVWGGFVPGPSGLPTLVLHGSDDPLTPLADAVAPFRGAPLVQVRVVEGGRHDVLNDVTHRSVAATVVLFLERLKLGAHLPVIVREEPAPA